MSDLIDRQAAIDKFIDGLEDIFADLRERHVDDSVCGLCEYDGAYIGQSGDWCNECPGFEKDDCFKLSDKTRKEWTEEIIKALPSVQPEQKWIPCSERLPEEPYGCLVTVWDTNPVTMDEFENILPYFVGWDGEQWNDGDGEQCPFEVVAWMPLPEPYRGD